MNNILIESNFNIEKARKLLKEDKIGCRKCGSNKVSYTKHLGWGEKMGTTYHYKLHCDNCGTKYYVKRDREVFEKVVDKQWIKSKSVLKMELKQKLI